MLDRNFTGVQHFAWNLGFQDIVNLHVYYYIYLSLSSHETRIRSRERFNANFLFSKFPLAEQSSDRIFDLKSNLYIYIGRQRERERFWLRSKLNTPSPSERDIYNTVVSRSSSISKTFDSLTNPV